MSRTSVRDGNDDLGPSAAGVLLLAVDRLPAWMLPMHGCRWVAMPALTRLASRGLTFDRVIATTDDAARTFDELTGGGAPPGDRPLVRHAVHRGWSPLLVTDAVDVGGGTVGQGGRDMGFRVVRAAVPPREAPAADETETALFRLCRQARDAIATGAHRLVIIEVTSLGRVWDAPRAFRDAYVDADDPPAYAGAAVPDLEVTPATDPDELVGIRQAFAGQLTLFDRCLDLVLSALPQPAAARGGAGWGVLVAGLRGLPLGLHGHVGPRASPAFGELVHVPAVLVDPAGRMAAQRWGGLVTPADLGATLLDVAGLGPAHDDGGGPRRGAAGGASLQELFESGRCQARDRVVCRVAAGPAVVTPAWQAVGWPGAAGVGPGTPRVFAKPDDYFDLNDVSSRCPEEAERFARVLAAVAAGDLEQAWSMPLDA